MISSITTSTLRNVLDSLTLDSRSCISLLALSFLFALLIISSRSNRDDASKRLK